jgi:hypothetical protein
MEITMCCVVAEDLEWCLLQSVHSKSSQVTENAKSSTAIVHIERDLKYIDAAFEKMKSDITNNISEVDKQKRKFLSDISDICKSLNDHLDKIEIQTVEEMVSVEQNLQVTSFTKDFNSDEKSSFSSQRS